MVTEYRYVRQTGTACLWMRIEEEVFLGHSVARTQNLSDETQKLVDSEIHVPWSMRDMLRPKRSAKKTIDELHTIANASAGV